MLCCSFVCVCVCVCARAHAFVIVFVCAVRVSVDACMYVRSCVQMYACV